MLHFSLDCSSFFNSYPCPENEPEAHHSRLNHLGQVSCIRPVQNSHEPRASSRPPSSAHRNAQTKADAAPSCLNTKDASNRETSVNPRRRSTMCIVSHRVRPRCPRKFFLHNVNELCPKAEDQERTLVLRLLASNQTACLLPSAYAKASADTSFAKFATLNSSKTRWWS